MSALKGLIWRHLPSPGHHINKTHLVQSTVQAWPLLPMVSVLLPFLLFLCMEEEKQEEGMCGVREERREGGEREEEGRRREREKWKKGTREREEK